MNIFENKFAKIIKAFLKIEQIQEKQEDYSDFISLIESKFKIYASREAVSDKENSTWESISYNELSNQSKFLANYFINQGIKKGDRIAIISEANTDWAIVVFASIVSGAITIPIHANRTMTELISLVSNCKPKIICVRSNFSETANQLKSQIQVIEQIVIIDDELCKNEFLSSYKVEKNNQDLNDIALIIYTSGTTGNPKGAMISFGNILSQLKDFDKAFNFMLEESVLDQLLDIIPGLITMLYRGSQITYTSNNQISEVIEILKEKKITALLTTPIYLKLLKDEIESEIRRSGKLFQIYYKISCLIPTNYLIFTLLGRIMFMNFHKRFGGKLKGFACGGAPLDPNIEKFFFRFGLPIFQGYGSTETSLTISANTLKYYRIGSVGKPYHSINVRISKDGEILIKGPNLMKGYYDRPDLTSEVIDKEGWLHTGDLGRFDKDGYLYITGRIKNQIAVGTGEKIQPEEVEETLSRSPLIKELCVFGAYAKSGHEQGTEEIIAVIVPTIELQQKFSNNIDKLRDKLSKEVDNLSLNLSPYKRPAKIIIRLEDLPRTHTGKVKIRLVQDWYNHNS